VWLKRFLAEQFPDAIVESLTTASDLEHSFSGLYVRGRMRDGPRMWAVLAVSPSENAAAVEGVLASGVLWLDWTRSHMERQAVEGIRLFVPEGASRVVSLRALGLSPAARTEIFEFHERDSWMRRVDCADAGNLESWLVPHQEAESSIEAARRAIARIHPLALHLLPAGDDISVRSVSQLGEVALCFRGLEFGRWSPEGISFGLGDARQRLSDATEPTLDALMRELDTYRSPNASDANHPLYRAGPERWIETLVLQDPARLDAQLDPRHFYSQVPALAAGDRGVIDLLGVTRRGRLVVIELKASEDIQLPMQAVDYWLRVRRHQRDGDFERCGYFVGAPPDPRPPLVWLVAPALRFLSATETLLKYLSPEIQVTRIGLNENWRRGLKVVFRQ